ncbi:MAG: hypothetical protein QM778_29800 [Myxococcales bacterium]
MPNDANHGDASMDSTTPGDGDGDGDGDLDASMTDGSDSAVVPPCGGPCAAPKGVCDEGNNVCVECTADHSDACTGANKVCKTSSNICVQCNSDSDCKTAEASHCSEAHTCEPCDPAGDNECGFVDGKHVCLSAGANGRPGNYCVECTREARDDCDGPANNKDVCNALTHACMDGAKEGSAPLCGKCPENATRCTCVSDDECAEGHACLPENFGNTLLANWYCMPLYTNDIKCGRPFIKEKASATTIEGSSVDACLLQLSTCSSHSDFYRTSCATDATHGSNAKCGVADVDDGYCVNAGAAQGWLCTVPCGIDKDCPDTSGADPTCQSVKDADGVSQSVCSK